MQISHRVENQICVAALHEDLVNNSPPLMAFMNPFIESKALKGIVLNLETVRFIDSTGIAQIVNLHKSLEAQHKILTICCLNARYLEIFKLMRLDQLIIIRETEAAALAAF